MASPTAAAHQVVNLGGNFGGLGAAHYLLRHTIPSLQQLDKEKPFHITLVTPNTHVFFKVGSPRALIQPGLLPEDQLWRPLSECFSRYKRDQITVVQAIATALDVDRRAVKIQHTGAGSSEGEIQFDSLVISTGTTSPSPAWTLHRDQSLTSDTFKSIQSALPKCKTITIVGGGPVGVETAGEIASAYPSVKLAIFSGGGRLLPKVLQETSRKAEAQLKELGVDVKHGIRVTDSTPLTEGGTALTLSNNSTSTTDLYIDATGGVPNTDFVPVGWLDESKRIVTRDAFLRVRGPQGSAPEGVYVIGDVVGGSNNTIFELDAMVPTACSSVGVDIAAKLRPDQPAAKKGGLLKRFLGGAESGVAQKEYKPMKDTIIVPIGPGGGVGQLFGWQMPSWFVRMAKGKTFLLNLFGPMVTGDKW